ncbi:hypothetical protein SAMN04487818_102257 [Actinokineospora terrae]|uniref:Uncharacterized protein n=1 Tax=Actinokineospora terrae TaxID=155974 RepID=A0A1H9MPE2_9PSEU|nr:hypothetical protein SAMN04487818_102257 [Actinokineospora terrae]
MNASTSASRGWSSRITASASSDSSARGSRPAATTWPAPNTLASCTANLPVTPVAPTTNTVSPSTSRPRQASGRYAPIPGLINAAASASPTSSGSGALKACWTAAYRAVPDRWLVSR